MKHFKYFVLLGLAITLVGAGCENTNIDTEEQTQKQTQEKTENTTKTTEEVKEFNVIGTNFEFSVTEIKVNKGDKVRIVFDNEEGFHDWVVDEFNAKTNKIQAGESETIEFIANKTGTFEYYCSVGSHRQMGMVGNLIVE